MELYYIDVMDIYVSLRDIREITKIIDYDSKYYFYIHYFNSKESIYIYLSKNSKNTDDTLNKLNNLRKNIAASINNNG